MEKINEVLRNKVSRRKFMAGIGAGVGATAAVALAAGCDNSSSTSTTTTPTLPTPVTDVDIMNFALSLEYLGAEYYLHGLTGTGLSDADALSGPAAIGGAVVPGLSSSIYAGIIADLAMDELGHVRALQAAITNAGGTPVARAQIDLTAFGPLATAAGVAGTFNPFDSVNDFILGAFVFEDVDVTAYTGAAPLISAAAVLDAAAGIQAVEAYHAGFVRTTLVALDAVSATPTLVATAGMIQALRSKLGGGAETTLSSTTIVNAYPSNSIGYARTTGQVLSIVFASSASGTTSGGFFPSGINGSINATS